MKTNEMNREDVIRIARECGVTRQPDYRYLWECTDTELERFAHRIAEIAKAEEREACAKVCEEIEVERTNYCMNVYEEGERYKYEVIAAIRARGEMR